MKVKDIMKTDVVVVAEESTLLQAAKLMSEHDISGAPVVNKDGELSGIISEKDLFKALYPSHAEFYDSPGAWIDLDQLEKKTVEASDKLISDLMTREVVTVGPDTSLMQVGSIMLVRGIHRVVVVVGKNSKISGIVTRKDIYRVIIKERLNI